MKTLAWHKKLEWYMTLSEVCGFRQWWNQEGINEIIVFGQMCLNTCISALWWS